MIRKYVAPDDDTTAMPAEDLELLRDIIQALGQFDELVNTWLTSHGSDCQCEPCVTLQAMQTHNDETLDALDLSLPAPFSLKRALRGLYGKQRTKQRK